MEAVAEEFGTPRRTLLTEARPSAAFTTTATAPAAATSLEIADTPCRVLLSTTGRVIRVDIGDGMSDVPARAVRRSKHDAIRSSVVTTSRTEIGAVTNLGRLVRLSPVDLPQVPENSIQLAAGAKVAEYLALDAKKEHVIALVSLDSDAPIALGTKQGVVKRLSPATTPAAPISRSSRSRMAMRSSAHHKAYLRTAPTLRSSSS